MAAHRIGLVVPSSNLTVETGLPALLSRHSEADFSFHASRMRMHTVSADQLRAMNAQREHRWACPPSFLAPGACYDPGSGRPPEGASHQRIGRPEEVAMTAPDHRARGVDHIAYPTFDPAATVKFYRDVLGFPVVHSICAAGWGPEKHPDFIHFFFDIGNDDRLAFFYYFGLEPFEGGQHGDAYSRFGEDVPLFFIRSRHLAIHVDTQEDLMEYRRRLDGSEWPVEMQIQHETIESIYTHDPNGYMIELTRALRPVTPQEDLDAELTIEALIEVTSQPDPSMAALLTRKAELIVERAAAWEEEHTATPERTGA